MTMKYILRTLWLIGYIPVFIFACLCFLVILFTFPLLGVFYFIKTGDYENVPFDLVLLPIYIDDKYKELLEYLR